MLQPPGLLFLIELFTGLAVLRTTTCEEGLLGVRVRFGGWERAGCESEGCRSCGGVVAGMRVSRCAAFTPHSTVGVFSIAVVWAYAGLPRWECV